MVSMVNVSGAYWTGSSAYIDLLREVRSSTIVDTEYKLFGFGELFEYLERLEKTHSTTKGLVGPLETFNEFNKSDFYPIRGALRRIFRQFGFYPYALFSNRSSLANEYGKLYTDACMNLYLELQQGKPCNKDKMREMINEIFHAIPLAADSEYIVFDQMVSPVYHQSALQYIENTKYIYVDRDWRDQYISMRHVYHGMLSVNNAVGIRPWGEEYQALLSMSPVNYFIQLRRSIDKIKRDQSGSTDILWVNFEDLIYDKKNTVSRVFDFLSISMEDWNEYGSFQENSSKLRTRKWECIENDHIHSEIQKIRSELGVDPYLDRII